MKFTRKCPKCDVNIFYKRKGDLQQGLKHNTICKKCVAVNKKHKIPNPKIYERKCPICNKKILHSLLKVKNRAEKLKLQCRQCASPFSGKKNNKLSITFNKLYESKRVEKECLICNNKFINVEWNKNQKYCSKECYYQDDNILKGKFKPSFNKKACLWFDQLNEVKGWKGLHALNGGEKKINKYWVDYYEPNLNIVIEWDEKSHNHPTQKQKDIERQNKIIEYLNCDFYRIEEKTLDILKINKDGKEERYKKDYWFT